MIRNEKEVIPRNLLIISDKCFTEHYSLEELIEKLDIKNILNRIVIHEFYDPEKQAMVFYYE